MTLEWIEHSCLYFLKFSHSNPFPESSYPDRILCGSIQSYRLWDSMYVQLDSYNVYIIYTFFSLTSVPFNVVWSEPLSASLNKASISTI